MSKGRHATFEFCIPLCAFDFVKKSSPTKTIRMNMIAMKVYYLVSSQLITIMLCFATNKFSLKSKSKLFEKN